MLMTVIAVYSLYILIKLYTSVMQIGYVNVAKRQSPFLMSSKDYLEAGNYSVAKEKFSMVSTLVEYIIFIAWMGGGITLIENALLFQDATLNAIAIVLGFILINSIISLPLDWYSKFVLDDKFGFNRSGQGLFIKDTLISLVMTVVIGALIIWGVFAIMENLALWWLWSFAFIFGIIILVNMLFPTIRAMFFDKITPLEDESLNAKIKELMDKTGFVSSGVFVSDASKRDARLNAYFGGLGKTKRVVLFDTLLEKLTSYELLAVLGHELGHFAHGDIYKNIAMVGAMMFGMFAIFGNIPESLFLELGIATSSTSIMLLFILLMPILSYFMMPLMGAVSRHNEFEADKTGAELGGKLYLAEALKKLVAENKSFPLSHPVYMFFNYTHPPVIERLKALGVSVQGSQNSSALEGESPSLEQ